ncbi:MAG: hypothetical protein V2I33_14780 [Kangiellaceae bacterium]|jgi:hypothetical protein|nr:hypothetical protein [Kangiellaceae bacterium]
MDLAASLLSSKPTDTWFEDKLYELLLATAAISIAVAVIISQYPTLIASASATKHDIMAKVISQEWLVTTAQSGKTSIDKVTVSNLQSIIKQTDLTLSFENSSFRLTDNQPTFSSNTIIKANYHHEGSTSSGPKYLTANKQLKEQK